MKRLILIYISILSSTIASEIKYYRASSNDAIKPYRYVLIIEGQSVKLDVEQKVSKNIWFSWSQEVKIQEAKKGIIKFSYPWGVIGKALQYNCLLTYDEISPKGFQGKLKFKGFEDSNILSLHFKPAKKEDLAKSVKEILKDEENQSK